MPTQQFTLIEQTLGLPLMRNVKRGLTQHAEVVKTNFHPILSIQLLNSIFIQVQRHNSKFVFLKLLLGCL